MSLPKSTSQAPEGFLRNHTSFSGLKTKTYFFRNIPCSVCRHKVIKMKSTIQRVSKARVTIHGGETRTIGRGLVVLIGVGENDTEKDAEKLADKTVNLRIFPNNDGKLDKSLLDINGEVLVISQFTLLGDFTKGRRPDFTKAAKPEKAIPLYEHFIKILKEFNVLIQTGEFGADMQVEIHNDGPVTLNLDSNEI